MDGLRIVYNDTLNGIELYFDKKPSAEVLALLKQRGEHQFYWNGKGKKWYGKRTPERESFVRDTFEDSFSSSFKKESDKDELSQPEKVKEEVRQKQNTFAVSFDSIGSDKIYSDGSISIVDFRNGFHSGYFEAENCKVSFMNHDETIYVEELNHALTAGESCKRHTLFLPSSLADDAVLYLCNELKFQNMADFITAVKNGEDLGELQDHVSLMKGKDVFSPFCVTPPLAKIPEKWTKTNFLRAFCSGQIYSGIQNYQTSDDYAFDSAQNFGRGREVSLPFAARDFVEHWGRSNSISCEAVKGDRAALKLCDYNSSTTFFFDLHCNIEKGILIREKMQQQKEQDNAEKQSKILKLSDLSVSPDKFYDVTYLVENENSGVLEKKTDFVQGISLFDYDDPTQFHWYYETAVSLVEKEIIPDQFYAVSNLFNEAIIDLSDERYIPIGNKEVLLSGQGILEMAQEHKVQSFLSERVSCGNSFSNAKEYVQSFIDGMSAWCVDVSKVDYSDSLRRIEKEEGRVSSLLFEKNDILNEKEKPSIDSLFHRISTIEAERKKGSSKGKGQQSFWER